MQPNLTKGISVVANTTELDTLDVISAAISKIVPLIQDAWGFESPQDCRIYIMTSWWGFIFQSAPWPWRILLASSFPFWCFRARRTWPYSAAWTQRYGHHVAIGIKPPRLLELSDKSIGSRIFVEEHDLHTKIRHLTCHELTHAFSAPLNLPAWLNEGLAAVTVDRYLQKRTIRSDTLELLRSFTPEASPPSYAKLSRMNADAIAYYAVLGYWLVGYLDQVRPDFLKSMFKTSLGPRKIDKEIALALELDPDSFWTKIPPLIYAHFEK